MGGFCFNEIHFYAFNRIFHQVTISPVDIIDNIIDKANVKDGFDSDLLKKAKEAKMSVTPSGDREDFCHLPLLTIDGADARDFDDAVAGMADKNKGYRLWVAIADVSAYVAVNSALDKEAGRRGNSIYLPDRALPMLPPTLSNDACSLNPEQKRLCLVCEMTIAKGEIIRYRFARGLMCSQRRMTYEQATEEMEHTTKNNNLAALLAVSQQLKQKRRQAGAFMMERPDRQVLMTDGAPQLQICRRTLAHIVIEECMIAANRCAADFLIQNQLPALHRIHKKPSGQSVATLTEVLKKLGVDFPSKPIASDFSEALDSLTAKHPHLVECLLPTVLGALARAEYAPDEKTGHFGLACARYAHFTSPIRRYPDLLAHRAIIAGLKKQKITMPDLSKIGEHCSQTESNADKMAWNCRQALLCWQAQQYIGREYDAFISTVTHFGVFVIAPELGIDGLVKFSALSGYWHYDAQLRQASNGKGDILSLGTLLRVRLTAVSPLNGRADFQVANKYAA